MAEERSEIAFFDVETTVPTRTGQGFAILEFGAILVCPRKLVELRSYSTLVRPADLSHITSLSVRCNGITKDAVVSAPAFADIADLVYDLLHGRIWAGHNILRFDCARIREAFAEINRPAPEPKGTIDSLALLTQKFGRRAGDMKMATLATYFGLGKQTHRSLDDVRMNLEVLKYCATVLFLDIAGSSVVKGLASSLRRPGVWTLPQAYVKAGATLLDIIQAKPSRLPISSQELFSILDDASESTFLCAGTAESVQKYVFDGETAKNSLELKNLVALASFLFEQLLVKAWIADKDAEALRCQKLLVEEEEAEQKRQAVILERKKQKKLRQKEQRFKEQYYGCSRDLNVYVDAVDRPTSAEASDLSSPSDSNSNSNSQEVPTTLDSVHPQNKEADEDIEVQFDASSEQKKQGDSPSVELQMVVANGHRHVATNRLQVPKSQRGSRYGLHANLNPQTLKHELMHKLGSSKDRSLQNGNKVWTKKLKSNNDGENLKPPLQEVTSHQIEQNNGEVIIGSIPVTLKSYVDQQQASHPNETQDTCSTEHAVIKKKNASEKPVKSNYLQSSTNRVASRLWRPVSRGETKNVPPVGRSNEDPGDSAILSKVHDHTPSNERSGQSQSLDNDGCHNGKQLHVVLDENAQRGFVPFSSEAAKEFLARRWKEAISGDHVKLVLSSGHEPPGRPDAQHASDPLRSNAPNHGENQFGRTIQVHAARKLDKNVKFKYIPKQKTIA